MFNWCTSILEHFNSVTFSKLAIVEWLIVLALALSAKKYSLPVVQEFKKENIHCSTQTASPCLYLWAVIFTDVIAFFPIWRPVSCLLTVSSFQDKEVKLLEFFIWQCPQRWCQFLVPSLYIKQVLSFYRCGIKLLPHFWAGIAPKSLQLRIALTMNPRIVLPPTCTVVWLQVLL